MTREAIAVAPWRVRLHQTRIRCLHIAETSLTANSVSIYCRRGHDAIGAVSSIDALLAEVAPRRAYPETAPRRTMAA